MALNNVVLIGRLTKDIELKKAGESTITNFTLAVDKPYNKNNDHPEANWIDCVSFNKTAEFLEKYFSKGNKVAVTGSLQTRSYENKDKVKIKVTEVLVSTVDFVESKNKSSDSNDTSSNGDISTTNDVVTSEESEANPDDMPF